MNGVVAVRKATETAIDLVAGCMVAWCSGALPLSLVGNRWSSNAIGAGGRNDGSQSQGQGLFPERPGRNLPLH